MRNHTQGMGSHRHLISSKAMAQLLAMAVGVTRHRRATLQTMQHGEIQPKLLLPNRLLLCSKVILPINSPVQTLSITHFKELLSQVMGFPLHPKQLMAINHSLVMVVQCNQGTVLKHMVLRRVASLVMVRRCPYPDCDCALYAL